jgi:toxin ParE1/3/4
MARNRLNQYRLTPAAQKDMEEIWRYGASTWSVHQADLYTDSLEDAFNRLLTFPELARERPEFTPPVRIYPSGEQIVVYMIADDHLNVMRILGGRQDWNSILRALDQ